MAKKKMVKGKRVKKDVVLLDVDLPDDLWKKIETEAKKENITVDEFINKALKEELPKMEKEYKEFEALKQLKVKEKR